MLAERPPRIAARQVCDRARFGDGIAVARWARTTIRSHMSKKSLVLAITGLAALAGGVALAQQSEFQAKIAEDMKSYQPRIVKSCGTTDKLALRFDGKLAGNPREKGPGDYTSISTLCASSGLGAVDDACRNNKVVASALSKVTDITCVRGTGTLTYKLTGSHLALVYDPTYNKNNGAGQRDDLIKALKRDLDK
jgi:hypothetical protein